MRFLNEMADDADLLPTDMRAAIEQFDREAEKIIAAFVGPMDAQPAAA